MKTPSLSKLILVTALLCSPIIASNALVLHSKSPRISSGTHVITCMPGLVFRCNQFGCFCVKP